MRENKEIRNKAKEMLLKNNNLFHMIFGICISLTSIMIPVMLSLLLADAILMSGLSEYILPLLLVGDIILALAALIFLTVPTVGGFFEMAYVLYSSEKKIYYADIFTPFKVSKKYLSIISAALLFIVRLFGCVLASYLIFYMTQFAYTKVFDYIGLPSHMEFLIYICDFLTSVICIGFFLVLVFLKYGGFFVPYFICKGHSFSGAMRLSTLAVKNRKKDILKYMLGFAGLVALSLLTVGALFVVYTGPLMIFSYFVYSDKSTENILIQRIGENKQ